MGAKELSLISKVIGAIYVIAYNLVYVLNTRNLPTTDHQFSIIQVGLFLMLVFSPVDISILIKNIKDIFNKTETIK